MKWAVPPSAPTLLVSNTGRVIRMASSRRKGSGWQTFPELELKPRRIGAGYLAINSKEQGRKRTLYVHRLVADAFLGKPDDANEVNHIDGNKANKAWESVEWTDHCQNVRHAVRHGLTGTTFLTPTAVKEIRLLLTEGWNRDDIATRFGVTRSAISHIAVGHTWAWLT